MSQIEKIPPELFRFITSKISWREIAKIISRTKNTYVGNALSSDYVWARLFNNAFNPHQRIKIKVNDIIISTESYYDAFHRLYKELINCARAAGYKNKGFYLEPNSPTLLKETRLYVYEAILQDAMLLEHSAPIFKNDFHIVKTAVERNGLALQFASPELKNNQEIVRLAVANNPNAFQFASISLRGNKAYILRNILEPNFQAIEHVAPPLDLDHSLALFALKVDDLAAEHINPQLFDDEDFIIKAITLSPALAFKISARVRANLRFMNKVLKSIYFNNIPQYQFQQGITRESKVDSFLASTELYQNLDFLLEIIKIDSRMLHLALKRMSKVQRDELSNNKLFLLTAASNNYHALSIMSEELKKDKVFWKQIIKINSLAIRYADNTIQDDEDIVVEALRQNPFTYEFISKERQSERNLVKQIIERNPSVLIGMRLPEPIANDSELAILAVKKRPILAMVFKSTVIENMPLLMSAIVACPSILKDGEFLKKITCVYDATTVAQIIDAAKRPDKSERVKVAECFLQAHNQQPLLFKHNSDLPSLQSSPFFGTHVGKKLRARHDNPCNGALSLCSAEIEGALTEHSDRNFILG
jgi:hypothetical protein